MRHRCHRLRRAGRNPDAVLCLQIAPTGRTVSQSDGLCRPHDAAVLSEFRLGAAATSGLRVSGFRLARIAAPPVASWFETREDALLTMRTSSWGALPTTRTSS